MLNVFISYVQLYAIAQKLHFSQVLAYKCFFFSLQSNQKLVCITLQSSSSALFHVLIAEMYAMAYVM